ncbi:MULTISPECIES: N-succinylarginine dihydrolase [unclassified Sphingopyxis]|uniref:N-succinylarginine dihydrolase n=1 Tax=unclassified Sphingopyxis TaxID=2614943 RepID=UPI000731812F|nr:MULTISPECIES: N-succinylarginine dihydrolase [unclassified Sphingopyxis]KTE23936.1 succinylarginine dihydrolase [Sphingopyxis sp. H057]KTE51089.1 succinylarginine dihydrolase [Sphingopyxis sp. H073]KTE51302.1 succinylarginine dihydrolase [Sphingopyxis sp. H071]KTE58793.1 succinylarginine dihydrolase [Sphingopyxis sp. H107]KTE63351.1 succinylarginine dihydrolase [Sphingopyxis sp. H100]
MLTEINFDGIIGPTHNYAGLSRGNIASASNAGDVSQPRAAALQGIEKMRHNIALGLRQGFFMPLDRPDAPWLETLCTSLDTAEPHLRAQAWSASSMWAANAATVSPAPDSGDGKCHLTVANLVTMPHRSHEWPGTLAQLRIAFADPAFAVHGPVPAPFGDEGAANHMRLCSGHGSAGVEIFVYGLSGGRFPARQHIDASKAIARKHKLDPSRTLFIRQSDTAIQGGAFHNDVVAVANEHVLFTHETAFEDREGAHAQIRAAFPDVEIVEVPASAVSLPEAIKSYLFNAQLVSLPDGGMGLVLPTEARETPAVWTWLEAHVAGNGPIRRLLPVDVRQSMANGGGPACLRLRVVADPSTVDPRFLADPAKLDRIADVVAAHWPEAIAPGDLASTALVRDVQRARSALLEALGLAELI